MKHDRVEELKRECEEMLADPAARSIDHRRNPGGYGGSRRSRNLPAIDKAFYFSREHDMVQMVMVSIDSDQAAAQSLIDQKKCGFLKNEQSVSVQKSSGDFFVYVRAMGTTDHFWMIRKELHSCK